MLSKIYLLVRTQRFFTFLTWPTRILLTLAFLPSGLKKVIGARFTLMPVDTNVGFFFEALYRTGFYWNFLGMMQLTAAALLLVPRTAYFGALLYLPIVANICVIVTAMQFEGTPVVAALMLLANIYLLVWDYPKTRRLVAVIFQKT